MKAALAGFLLVTSSFAPHRDAAWAFLASNKNFCQVKRADNNIEDVYDGTLYQGKCGPGGFLSEPYNLSVKLNTDGVAIFRSSQFGVWPLFLLVNELPPSLR